MDFSTATIDLKKLNDETFEMDKTDYMVWLGNKGVPVPVLTRMEPLWDKIRRVNGEIIYIGKIIIGKIVEFIQLHPHAVVGLAIGAAIGALVGLVPFIGPLLAPLTTAIGAVYGLSVGAKLDYTQKPDPNSPFEGLLMLAKDFFKVLADIFCQLKDELFRGGLK